MNPVKMLFSYKKIILIFFILPLMLILGRTYYIYHTFMHIANYNDATNYLIQHKTTFITLYTMKPWHEKLCSCLYTSIPKKTTAEKLADWVEARIMHAIINNEKIQSVKDLPCLERSVIRALDGSSYINSLYQKALYYVTRTQPAPKS